ncbi:MAG: hypothetical protein ACOYBY_11960 [Dermatophilaceae bacterium]
MSTSTRPPSTPVPSNDPTERDARTSFLDLSGSQVLGGALAAATSALALSFFGVAGTLIGAMVGSLVATIGAALYSRSLRLAAAQLRVVRVSGQPGAARDTGDVAAAADEAVLTQLAEVTDHPVQRRWLRLVAGIALGAVLALAAITGVELFLGHPVSGSTTSGTTIGQAVGGAPRAETSTTPAAPTSTTSHATSQATRSTASPTTSAATSVPTQGGAGSSTTTPTGNSSIVSPGGQASAGAAPE